MAVINESVTGNTASTTANPANTISAVIIEGTGQGKVLLQVLRPTSTKWITLHDQGGAFTISTPDPALTYRFLPVNVTGNVGVYFGE